MDIEKGKKMKKVPIVIFNFGENNKLIVEVNEGMYKDEEFFKYVIKAIYSWLDYQLPNMEQTMKNAKLSEEEFLKLVKKK